MGEDVSMQGYNPVASVLTSGQGDITDIDTQPASREKHPIALIPHSGEFLLEQLVVIEVT